MPSPVLRRCFELSGVVPLGVFLLVHVGNYARALAGATDYGVATASGFVTVALELALVWVPLLFHAGYGAWLATTPLGVGAEERRRSLLIRVSGVCVVPFVVAHALWLRWPILRGERAPEDVAEMLAARLSETIQGFPFVAVVHLLGVGAICVHLGFALPRFMKEWGIAEAVRARRIALVACWALFALGAATVVELASGSAAVRFLSR